MAQTHGTCADRFSGVRETLEESLEAHDVGASVAVYLDGGPSGEAVPSSIVDLTGPVPVLLRAGAVGLDELRTVVPDLQVAG